MNKNINEEKGQGDDKEAEEIYGLPDLFEVVEQWRGTWKGTEIAVRHVRKSL